jgi:prevent-host-death family protein
MAPSPLTQACIKRGTALYDARGTGTADGIADLSAVGTAEEQVRLAEIGERAAAQKERVVLTRGGKPVAAVVPVEDVAALEALEDELDAAELRARVAECEAEGRATVPIEEIAVRYGLRGL